MPPEIPALPSFRLQRAVSAMIVKHGRDYWTGTVYTTNRRVWEHDDDVQGIPQQDPRLGHRHGDRDDLHRRLRQPHPQGRPAARLRQPDDARRRQDVPERRRRHRAIRQQAPRNRHRFARSSCATRASRSSTCGSSDPGPKVSRRLGRPARVPLQSPKVEAPTNEPSHAIRNEDWHVGEPGAAGGKGGRAAGGDIVARYFREGVAMRSKDVANLVSDADVEAERAVVEVIRDASPATRCWARRRTGRRRRRAPLGRRPARRHEQLRPQDPPVRRLDRLLPRRASPSAAWFSTRSATSGTSPSEARGRSSTAGAPASPSRPGSGEALVGVGFYYDRGAMMDATLAAIGDLKRDRQIHGIRRFGAAPLDLCMVGLGHARRLLRVHALPLGLRRRPALRGGGRRAASRPAGRPLPLPPVEHPGHQRPAPRRACSPSFAPTCLRTAPLPRGDERPSFFPPPDCGPASMRRRAAVFDNVSGVTSMPRGMTGRPGCPWPAPP